MAVLMPSTDGGGPWTVELFYFGRSAAPPADAMWRHRNGVYQRHYRNVFSSFQEALSWISSVRRSWPNSVFDSEARLRGETETVDFVAVLWFQEADQEYAKNMYLQDKEKHEAGKS